MNLMLFIPGLAFIAAAITIIFFGPKIVGVATSEEEKPAKKFNFVATGIAVALVGLVLIAIGAGVLDWGVQLIKGNPGPWYATMKTGGQTFTSNAVNGILNSLNAGGQP